MPRPVRRARVLQSRGPIDSRELARSLEAERKVLEPLLPDMDPGDLLLILENLIRGAGSGRNLFVREIRPGVYVT